VEQILSLIIIILLAVIILQIIFHARERRELYNRIMAHDLRDYVANQGREPPKSRNFIRKSLEKAYDLVEGGEER